MDTQKIKILHFYGLVRVLKQSVFYLTIGLLAFGTLLTIGCQRRLLEEDENPSAAYINVKIDWSQSGLNDSQSNGNGNKVHSVTIRFFPKDNHLPVYNAYLEGNVTEGSIFVPIGKYSVIIFNESDEDVYWDNAITFTDANSYDNFAANVVPLADAQRIQRFPYYVPASGERIVVEPLPLASWCLDDFEVTPGMVMVSQGEKPVSYLTRKEREMFDSFNKVVMRALTRPVYLTTQVENLASMATGYMAIQGLACKIYMASGMTASNTATFLFTLNGRQYDADGKNGVMNNRFLIFGHAPASGLFDGTYKLAADILLITGELYKPTSPLLFDMTNQVLWNYKILHNINLNIDFALPYVNDDIGVTNWDDDNHYIIK
jgi:hypothetical protein